MDCNIVFKEHFNCVHIGNVYTPVLVRKCDKGDPSDGEKRLL